ncbi:hypothetical protein IV417_15625 [Alphaproteobacteria bacterium KMM 3653]|uniref:Clp protease n=1 Tax=Harenicola maris TaxID=2841044 RepID=A0AAP2CQT0_9RHOB|nr:hypothetical protein [Harenicola maris]
MAVRARTALRAIFGLQLGIALVLLGRDFAIVLPSLRLPSFAPAPDVPITPGDQTRRFDPAKSPPRQTGRPGEAMPANADMPSRLFFEAREGGGTVIYGQIKEGDFTRFSDWLEDQSPAPETLWLNSPGGSVSDALDIGRLIRERGITTAMDADGQCLSACPYILMGGAERHITKGAWVGVHQHYYGKSVALPAFLAVEDIQRSQAEVVTYLDTMGIDPLIMRHSLATPPNEIYILLDEELTGYNVATELSDKEE